ncbi:MAG: FAD-binding domain-containing protein [Thermaurantiacus tibetensis]
MFPATRAAALARLEAFLPRAGRAYAERRNLDEGPGRRTDVSGLSPAIRRRLVTEEEVAKAAVAAHGLAAAEKFVAEVCWRSYWRGHLETRPALWQRYRDDLARLDSALGRDASLAARFAEAVSGRTGIDCFDAWAHELVETGYLHNHARMNFASIWIFTLRLPWQLGAAHFFRHLLDACPASNTLSWRWVAGLQTAGKTYLARPEIIRKTSLGRFRVDAPLATAAPPPPPEPPAPLVPLAPLPAADPEARTGVFLHTEDLSPETLPLPAHPVALAAVDAIGGDPAELKRAHANAALEDGVARAAAHFGLEPERLPEAALEEAMRGFAARHRLAQILTPFAPVGPVASRLARLAATLAGDGVRLVPLRRAWDARAFPHAGRGFFAFRQVIPELVG